MMLLEKYFDELEVGERWVSRGRTITEADIVNFCYLSGDWYPIHSNSVYAEYEGPFGARIAHGFLLLAVVSGLIVPPEPGALMANYGVDGLRFTRSVMIGDTVHAELEILAKQLRDDKTSGIVDVKVEAKNQNNILVMTFVEKTLTAVRSTL